MSTNFLSAAAALSLIASPAIASNPAAKLSLHNNPAVRAGTQLKRPGHLDRTAVIAAIVGLVVGVGAIVLSIDSDNDDEPDSR